MSARRSAAVVRQIEALFRVGTAAGLSDGQLLERFRARRDEAGEAAFAALLERHGPMVLGVCRRVLGDLDAADDAFQATFLMLARRAGSIRDADRLAPWLHRVARRTSQRARARTIRDREVERRAKDRAATIAEDRPLDDLQRVLDEEIDRLPRSFREPVTLCYLEGLTHDEAALRLRCPVGTVRSRLARARERLRRRLAHRGLAPTASLLATALAPKAASAAVPATLIGPTARAALAIATGKAIAAGTVPAAAVGLFQQGIKAMMFQKLGAVLAVVLVAGSGVGLAVTSGVGGMPEEVGQEVRAGARPSPQARPIDDHKAIQGEWKVVAMEQVNHEMTEEEREALRAGSLPVTITADRIIFDVPNGGSARYELDPTTTPKQMRYTAEGAPGPAPAIYELKGDTLKICLGRIGDEQPPRGFDINDRRPGEFPTLYVLERFTPEERERIEAAHREISGSWRRISSTPDDGVPSTRRRSWSFWPNRQLLMIDGKLISDFRYWLGTPHAPNTIDIDDTSSLMELGYHRILYGIYQIDGDILTICYAEDPAERPTDFQPGEGRKLLRFVRSRSYTSVEGWGTLRGQVLFDGEPPEPRVLIRRGEERVNDGAVVAQRDILDESLLVHPVTRGVRHAFVYLVEPTAIHERVEEEALAPAEFRLDRGVFEPHALGLMLGAEVVVRSDQPIYCNVRFAPPDWPGRNWGIAPGTTRQYRPEAPARFPFLVQCDIHPWQRGFWMVTDHPYITVTDDEGNFEIEHVPAGPQRVVVWQESVGFVTPRDGVEVEIRADEKMTATFLIAPES